MLTLTVVEIEKNHPIFDNWEYDIKTLQKISQNSIWTHKFVIHKATLTIIISNKRITTQLRSIPEKKTTVISCRFNLKQSLEVIKISKNSAIFKICLIVQKGNRFAIGFKLTPVFL